MEPLRSCTFVWSLCLQGRAVLSAVNRPAPELSCSLPGPTCQAGREGEATPWTRKHRDEWHLPAGKVPCSAGDRSCWGEPAVTFLAVLTALSPHPTVASLR